MDRRLVITISVLVLALAALTAAGASSARRARRPPAAWRDLPQPAAVRDDRAAAGPLGPLRRRPVAGSRSRPGA